MTSQFPQLKPDMEQRIGGFTLVELLVSVAVLAIIMLLASEMIGETERLWKTTSTKIDSFRGARLAFELMTDELRQATVNTYYDYFDANGRTLEQFNAVNAGNSASSFAPVAYGRESELHFICGPVNGAASSAESGSSIGPKLTLPVPGGGGVYTHGIFFQYPQAYTSVSGNAATSAQGYSVLSGLLNATGFFVEFGPDTNPSGGAWVANGPPSLITSLPTFQPTYRFHLMQFIQPTEDLAVYSYSTTAGTGADDWFTSPISTNHAANVRILADNVIALIVWPKETDSTQDTLAPAYVYDSRLGAASGSSPWTPNGSASQPLQMNQMPPILKVAIVSIDETSAKILQGSQSTAPAAITSALSSSNPSTGGALFTSSINMDSDLTYLETKLAAIKPHVDFRVFSTTLAIRSSKFSTVGQ